MMMLHLCATVCALYSTSVAGQYTNFLPAQQPLHDTGIQPPRLNFSSPSPLIFHATFGLLQQWPNTFFPNGHTIALCTVAKNTNLYHARNDAEFPPSPEWFAFDPEMSYAILGTTPNSHLLTFRTNREVKALYFDGTSASLMDDGSMLAQMLLLHNSSANVPDHPAWTLPPPANGSESGRPCMGRYDSNCTHWNPLKAEYDRARGLCDLIKHENLGGLGWGYEGIVRMNAGFELIWCNFSSPSIRLVSWLNVSAPLLDGVHGITDRREMSWASNPYVFSGVYDWYRAATKRFGFVGGAPGRGEPRVRVDAAGLSTFYDPALYHQEATRVRREAETYNLTENGYWASPVHHEDRQAALKKLTRRRHSQMALNVTESDGAYLRAAVLQRMREALTGTSHVSSGIDWLLAAQEIVTSWSTIIYDVRNLLATNLTDLPPATFRAHIKRLRQQAHAMWMPYFEYPHYEPGHLDEPFSILAPTSRAALERCNGQVQPDDAETLYVSENVTLTAFSEVLSAICSTSLPVFLDIERIWLVHFNNLTAPLPDASSPVYTQITDTLRQDLLAVEDLMAWLGWADQWTACDPGCGMTEVCRIFIWPTFGGFLSRLGPGNGTEYGPGNGTYRKHPGPFEGVDLDDMLWNPVCMDAEHWMPPDFREGYAL